MSWVLWTYMKLLAAASISIQRSYSYHQRHNSGLTQRMCGNECTICAIISTHFLCDVNSPWRQVQAALCLSSALWMNVQTEQPGLMLCCVWGIELPGKWREICQDWTGRRSSHGHLTNQRMKEKCHLMWENHNEYVSEKVGQGHVTYVCKQIYVVSLWWFLN